MNLLKNYKEEKNISTLAEQFVLYLNSGDLESTQEFFDKKFNYFDECPYYFENEETIKVLQQKTSYDQKDIVVNKNAGMAYVNFDVTHPDYIALMETHVDSIDIYSSDTLAADKVFMEGVEDSNIEYVTESATLNFKKVNNEWKIINDDYLFMFIFYGKTSESSFEGITDN